MNTILFISSNPSDTPRLDTDEELRWIQDSWQRSLQRPEFHLEWVPAARTEDVHEHIMIFAPSVVHFSGHGGGRSVAGSAGREVKRPAAEAAVGDLIVKDAGGGAVPVSSGALEALFQLLRRQVRLVVLNACHTLSLARAVARHVDCAIGTSNAIPDPTAIEFARHFYLALCSGQSVGVAFEYAKARARETGDPSGADVLVLCCREGVDPGEVRLAAGDPSPPEDAPAGGNSGPEPRWNQLWSGPARLFGRDADLAWLDAAVARSAGCVALVGLPTVGKTALSAVWARAVATRPGRPAIFAWSFDARDNDAGAATTSDAMLEEALRWIGDPDPTAGTRPDRARRVGRWARSHRALLLLDEVNALQGADGGFRDDGLKHLVRCFREPGAGTCVLMTTLAPPDVEAHKLGSLPEQSAAEMLHELGMRGPAEARRDLARRYGCNPFALTLRAHLGDDAILPDEDDRLSAPELAPLIAAYDVGLDPPGRALFLLASAFEDDVPVPGLQCLLRPPPITGVTDELPAGKGPDRAVMRTPVSLGLIELDRPREEQRATIHVAQPVRDYFSKELMARSPAAWKEVNRRLFEHYRSKPVTNLRTASQLAPIYRAVRHGCRAEQFPQAYELYRSDVCRGDDLNILGFARYADEVRTLSCFQRAVEEPGLGLRAEDAVDVLHRLAFCYRALGRPGMAVDRWKTAFERCDQAGLPVWRPTLAGYLCQAHLAIAMVDDAVSWGQRAVALSEAEHGRPHASQRLATARTILASALLARGDVTSAGDELRKAGIDELDGFDAYRHIDFLLATGDPAAAKGYVGKIVDRRGPVLKAFRPLYEARIRFVGGEGEPEGILAGMSEAVKILRDVSRLEDLARALLWRAEASCSAGRLGDARQDVAEAGELAEHGGLDLLAIDAQLAAVRLAIAEGAFDAAAEAIEDVASRSAEQGYGLRVREVEQLRRRISTGAGRAA